MGSIEAKEFKLKILLEDVKGFYIPDYQRPYTWDEENIKRLIETITSSIDSFFESDGKEDYYAFLGAILTVSGSEELKVAYNIQQDEAPGTVHALIDGQQRITSLILLIAEFYKRFYRLKKEFESIDKSIRSEINNSITNALNDARTFLFIRNAGFERGQEETNHEFLPKIINGSKEDVWKKYNKGSYNSPIAKYLLNLSFYNSNDELAIPEDISNISLSFNKSIDDYLKDKKNTHRILNGKILHNKTFQEKLLYKEISADLKKYIENGTKKELVQEFLNLSILFRFISQYIMFAKIEVGKETFAFDIFDSLNSTGDPLTAFETFKPKVIQYLGNNFKGSNEEAYLKKFTDYMKEEKGEARHKSTKEYIISFALYEDGSIVDKTLNKQRKYLRDRYEKHSNIEKKKFCENFSLLTDFYSDIWDEEIASLNDYYSSECKLGLAILKDTTHTITIPVLARYYSELILPDPDNQNSYKYFSKIVQSVVAFSLFWRLLHNGGTAGIEDIYRKLLEIDLCRIKKTNLTNYDINKFFKKNLDVILHGRNKKATFVDIVKGSQYSQTGNNRWLKFFMLAALHDTVPDGTSGLDKHSTPGVRETLKYENWKSLEPLTIEHIAPQRPDDDTKWDPILLNPTHVDSIGNLTLLPRISNSIIGNKEWKEKKEFYSILSLKDPDKRFTKIKDQLEKINSKTTKYLKDSKYCSYVEALAAYNGKWNSEAKIIQKRAERLAELAWDNLSPWLGY